MKKNKHSMLTLVFAAAYFLSACTGTLPQDNNSNDAAPTASPIASSTPILPVASTTVLPGGTELEVFGIVESMTETSITINGVTYNIVADLTQFNDVVSVGDQVRIFVIVNADGTFTIREIEISIGNDNGNANNNVNSNDNSNVNSNDANNNSNTNKNDNNNANSNDASNNDSNTNDDNGNDSNSSDDNSNDGNGNDDGGNDNDNDSSGSGSGGNDNDDNGGNDNEGNDNG